MRLLLDGSADARLATYLRRIGHDVTVVGGDDPSGITDHQVLAIAVSEQRILFRLSPYADLASKVARLDHVLTRYATDLDQFLVVTRDRVRIRRADERRQP
jgi:predicted nuclease of predicted toxin-antitoxin system